MKPVFLSFLLAKLKQIHIDKSKTTGYSTDIPHTPGSSEFNQGLNVKFQGKGKFVVEHVK